MSEPVTHNDFEGAFSRLESIVTFDEIHKILYGDLSFAQARASILNPYEGHVIQLRGKSRYQFHPETLTWEINIEAPDAKNPLTIDAPLAPISSTKQPSPSHHTRGLYYHNKVAMIAVALQATSKHHNIREIHVALNGARLNRAQIPPGIPRVIIKNSHSPLYSLNEAMRQQHNGQYIDSYGLCMAFMLKADPDIIIGLNSNDQEIATKRALNLSCRRIFVRSGAFFADGSPVAVAPEH